MTEGDRVRRKVREDPECVTMVFEWEDQGGCRRVGEWFGMVLRGFEKEFGFGSGWFRGTPGNVRLGVWLGILRSSVVRLRSYGLQQTFCRGVGRVMLARHCLEVDCR